MILRRVYFPPSLGASGVQGFYGNQNHLEYQHSKIIKSVYGNIFKDMGLVAKTGTVDSNKGNVALSSKDGYSFTELLPKAIYPMPLKNAALNAVKLSNPGFPFLLKTGIWQKRAGSFMLSYMPIRATYEERIEESCQFVGLLKMKNNLPAFRGKIGLQLNLSCPSTNHQQNELVTEAEEHLSILGELGIPLIVKINAVLSAEIAHKILDHPECDALCCSNTIPFGELPNQINWEKYGKKGDLGITSPLQKYGFAPGGLSGAPLFPVVYDWLERFFEIEKDTKPIIAGGGVMTESDVFSLARFPSVQAISLGTVALTRPWRVPTLIKRCYYDLADG